MLLRTLIIEDDASKCLAIQAYLKELVNSIDIEVCESVHEGTKAILKNNYDLVIIDMSLTTYSIGTREGKREFGGRPQGFGGSEVLRFMRRKKRIMPSVVITQFEKFGSGLEEMTLSVLEEKLTEQHGDSFMGVIYYTSTSAAWKAHLRRLISTLAPTNRVDNNV